MQTKFSKSIAAVFAALVLANVASAHPGHAPTDLAAQVSQPFAGPDHLVAFVALTSLLLAALAIVLKARHGRTKKGSA
jgi:hydrogenase/urease accessory protein HupE